MATAYKKKIVKINKKNTKKKTKRRSDKITKFISKEDETRAQILK